MSTSAAFNGLAFLHQPNSTHQLIRQTLFFLYIFSFYYTATVPFLMVEREHRGLYSTVFLKENEIFPISE